MNFIEYITENKPFTFAKFGDGEYLVCKGSKGQNCDNTKYTEQLGNAVINSYKYLSSLENSYLGRWEDDNIVYNYFENIAVPNWVDYHSIIFKNIYQFYDKLPLLKTIKNSKQEKIYVCNERLNNITPIFNIQRTVLVHPSDWFELNYNDILEHTISSVKNPDSVIIMTSAGMGAKPLLSDLRKTFPNAILIDIGSAFDIFTYTSTRNFNTNVPKHIVDELIKLI